MSLILEALKKAERQHRLGEVPGIDAAPVNRAPAGSRWPVFLLLALVASSMLVLGLYLGGGEDTRQPGTKEKTLTAEPARIAPVQPPDQATRPEHTISLPRVAEAPRTDAPAAIAKPAETPVVEAVQPMVAPLEVMPEPPPPVPKAFNELPDGFVDNLPSLNIDIHSYDRKPDKRYVLINLQKYRVGDYLAEGPRLSEILTDGVVLEHMGERFILPIGNH